MAKPNILIILADDIGIDIFRIDSALKTVTAHVVGKTVTAGPIPLPIFGKMLASGVHFQHAWAHPVCTPTRASLWTGMQPWKTPNLGYPTGGADVLTTTASTGEAIRTLAERFADAGSEYRCAMFGKWDLGAPADPVKRGWSHFAGVFRGGLRSDGKQRYGIEGRVTWDKLNGTSTNATFQARRQDAIAKLRRHYDEAFLANAWDLRFYIWEKDIVEPGKPVQALRPPSERAEPYATADQVHDAKAWLAANGSQGPWCIALNLLTPHDPLHVPPPGTFQPSTIPNPAEPAVQQLLAAMLESMSYYVNDLLTSLGDALANTIVVFVGDNGTQDRDLDTGASIDAQDDDDKSSEALGGVQVPMLIADGGLMANKAPCFLVGPPRAVQSLVHVVDLYNTVLEAAGIAPPSNDSVSIVPQLKQTGGATRKHNFSQFYLLDEATKSGRVAASVCDEGYRYKLTCKLLTTGSQSNYADRNGNLSSVPVYDYVFSEITPEEGIPGSYVNRTITGVLAPNADGSFSVTNPSHRPKLMELYERIRCERLDAALTPLPLIVEPSIASYPTIALTTGQSITVPSIDLHATDFTIATKLMVSSTANRNIILGNWGSSGNSWQLMLAVLAGGAPMVWLRKDMITNGSDPAQSLLELAASKSVVAGRWHHVAVTFGWGVDRKSPSVSLYVDGVPAGTASTTPVPGPNVRNLYQLMPSANPYLIGRKQDSNDAGSWFNGEMQRFRIYAAALSAAEVGRLASE